MAMAMEMDTWILRHKSTTVGSRDRLQHTEAEGFVGKHFKVGFSLVYLCTGKDFEILNIS